MSDLLLSAAQSRYITADGGISTTLFKNGSVPEGSRPEVLNRTNPDAVNRIHTAFREAGAQCLTTNTFGLTAADFPAEEDRVFLAGEGARLARQAAGNDRYVLGVLGAGENSVGAETFTVLGKALTDAGVDLVVLETCTSVAQSKELVAALREGTGKIPVMVSFTFARRSGVFELASSGGGEVIDDVCGKLGDLAADAIGINCGKGLDLYDYNTILASIRAVWPGVIAVRPSAGDPMGVKAEAEYPEDPFSFTEAAWGWVRAGANIVGGCCGVTPEFIETLSEEMERINS